MFNILKEIVNYTMAVDLDLVRISGTKDQTLMQSVSADKNIVLEARFNQPVPEFSSVLGLPNLGRLNVILNIPEYREDPQVTLNSNSANILESISILSLAGDKQISISDAGAMRITVNSGVATYNYILMAQGK